MALPSRCTREVKILVHVQWFDILGTKMPRWWKAPQVNIEAKVNWCPKHQKASVENEMTVSRAPNLHITNLPRRVDRWGCRSHNNNIAGTRTFVACHYPAIEKPSSFWKLICLFTLLPRVRWEDWHSSCGIGIITWIPPQVRTSSWTLHIHLLLTLFVTWYEISVCDLD